MSTILKYLPLTMFLSLLISSSVAYGGGKAPAPGAKVLDEASNNCQPDVEACIAIGQWEFSLGFGLGLRSNPVADGDDVPIIFLPEWSYYGKRFFIDNFVAGLTLVESRRHMINLVVTPGFDQMFFNEWSLGNFSIESSTRGVNVGVVGGDQPSLNGDDRDGFDADVDGGDSADQGDNADKNPAPGGDTITVVVPPDPEVNEPTEGMGSSSDDSENDDSASDDQNSSDQSGQDSESLKLEELRDRKMAGMFGLEYGFYGESWSLQIQALSDVSGVHDGSELRFAAEKVFQGERNMLGVAVGGTWQSADILTYYYGIGADEVSDSALAYEAQSGLSPFIRLDWQRSISKRWTLRANFQQKWLSDQISDSPLLDEDSVTTVYFGGVYHF